MSSILWHVSTRLTLASAPARSGAHYAAAAAALAFGAFLVFVAGFAGADVLHNAAHDGRHAFAFPCH